MNGTVFGKDNSIHNLCFFATMAVAYLEIFYSKRNGTMLMDKVPECPKMNFIYHNCTCRNGKVCL